MAMPPCLAIDTAGPYCSVALVGDNGPLAAMSERIERGHAERLMPMIDDVLGRSGAHYRDIELIGVTTGPGSFTGVRIGISAARGLALAIGIEAFGLGILDVMTEQAVGQAGAALPTIFVAVLPAVRDDIFVQASKALPGKTGERQILLSAARTKPDCARRWIDSQAGPVRLFGSGAAAIERDTLLLPAPASMLDHADVTLLADMVRRGSGTTPPRPLYLRAPDARAQTGKAVEHA